MQDDTVVEQSRDERLKKRALHPGFSGPATGNWNVMPRETWNQIIGDLRGAFPATTLAIFILGLYEGAILLLETSTQFPRPPNGLVLKHLGLFLLHWLLSGEAYKTYGYEGRLSMGSSKSYVLSVIQYVLGLCETLVHRWVSPRSAEETERIADERLTRIGMPFPSKDFKSIW